MVMSTPLPFVWPYALAFWLVYIWAFSPEFRILKRTPLRGTPAPVEDQGSARVVVIGGSLVILLSFVIALLARRAKLPGDPRVWFVVGVLALIAGSLLRRHCFKVLGRFFTGAVTIQSDHRVIDSGAYRWVRHPSYSAALLMTLGIGLSLGNWLSVLISIVGAFSIYTYRARVEERALLSALGAPYADFLAKRKRFIPFIV
jgi:protein-S-isoprenylcysteine O-methyltransferase Ste14